MEAAGTVLEVLSDKKLWLEGQGSQERTANAGESRWKLQGRFWRCYPSVSEPYKKLRLGQEPVEAAERVLEVLSGSFETLQKAVAGRPREPGASSQCRCAVKAGGSCRDGFGGAIRQFRNPTKSCGWKAKGAGQGSQERTANAGESRWKLQGRFWRCYPSASKPYKKLRLGQDPLEAAERVLEVLSGSFETLQNAVAGRPREPGASS